MSNLTTHWLKEIPRNVLYLPTGGPVPFEAVSNEYGILATADPVIIGELEKAVARQIGGVSKITESEYVEFQKKSKELSSLLNLPRERETIKPMTSAQLQSIRQQGRPAAVEVAVNPPLSGIPQPTTTAGQQRVDPLTVPKEFQKPKIGRVPPAVLKP